MCAHQDMPKIQDQPVPVCRVVGRALQYLTGAPSGEPTLREMALLAAIVEISTEGESLLLHDRNVLMVPRPHRLRERSLAEAADRPLRNPINEPANGFSQAKTE